MLFRRKDVKNEQEKPAGGHGSHWDCVVEGIERENLTKLLMKEVAAKSDVIKHGSIDVPRIGKVKTFSLEKKRNDALLWIVVAEEPANVIITFYPQNLITTKHEIAVVDVVPWKNDIEGWVKCEVGDAGIYFFPTDFYRNRDLYTKGSKHTVHLSAFAYSLNRFVEEDNQTKERSNVNKEYLDLSKKPRFTKDSCALIPYAQFDTRAFPDDYCFSGQITDVVQAGNDFVFKTRVINFEAIKPGTKDFEIWIYARGSLLVDTFKKGDTITGVLWLQGWIEK